MIEVLLHNPSRCFTHAALPTTNICVYCIMSSQVALFLEGFPLLGFIEWEVAWFWFSI